MEKKRRPKVSLPGPIKDLAMLSPSSRGRIDRQYIKFMCEAVHSYEKHRNSNLRQVIRESSND